MTVTRSQKACGVVLAVAVTAFVWDRSSSGSPAAASAAPASLLVPHEPVAAGSDAGKTNTSDALWRAGWASRLNAIAREQCLDASGAGDAFAISTPWTVEKPVEVIASTQPAVNVNKELADAFRRHRLDAVVVGHRGYANVEGQGIFVGEVFDGFKLMSVTKSTALFGLDNTRVELKLHVDSKLNRVGGVIENASPRAAERSGKMLK
jgi:hypothetical protein